MTLKDKLPRSVGAQCGTGEQWRNKSRNDEEMEPKQKQCPVVDVTCDEVKSNAVKSNTASVSKFSRSVMSDSLQPHVLQHARLLCLWDSQARVLE